MNNSDATGNRVRGTHNVKGNLQNLAISKDGKTAVGETCGSLNVNGNARSMAMGDGRGGTAVGTHVKGDMVVKGTLNTFAGIINSAGRRN